jgi:hypothetical protein
VRLPPYWAERPAVWFAQAKVQFTLAGISSEKTKFYYVISQLDQRYATEVEDIICPPERAPYTKLKTELVRRLSPSKEHRIRVLLTLEDMGDRKPSQFLRQSRPRHARQVTPQHLVQPTTLPHKGRLRRPTRGRLGHHRPLRGPHY